MAFADSLYTFRRTELVFAGAYQPRTPEESALADIDAKLVEANRHYLGRRYQDAIAAYVQARDLIHAQLDPGHRAGSGLAALAPRDLFDGLLSTSIEWLNILPVPQPPAIPRPRVAVDSDRVTSMSPRRELGLTSAQLGTDRAAGAAADWRLATTYQQQGNERAAAVFQERARSADERVTSVLSEHRSAPSAPEVTGDRLAMALRPLTGTTGVASPLLPAELRNDRRLKVFSRGRVHELTWSAGEAPALEDVKALVYKRRIGARTVAELREPVLEPGKIAVTLPHDYYYTIPLGLAECYHALGDYPAAETHYFAAAAYEFLNPTMESPYLWHRLATLYLDWGNTQFREEDAPAARITYENVLTIDGAVPTSRLHTETALGPGATQAQTIILNLEGLIRRTTTAKALGVDPAFAATILEVRQQLLKIQGGLDFWGHWTNSVPIWTFDYLQSTAINFTQLAINAERDFIDFQDRADQAKLTRQQLAQSVDQVDAELNTAALQAAAAAAEVNAYGAAQGLAQQRANHARTNAIEYAQTSAMAIQFQALSTQLSGGDDGDPQELNNLANRLELFAGGEIEISGSSGTLAAVSQLLGLRRTQEYEVSSLNRIADEMKLVTDQAKAELVAAQARADVADAGVAVARLRADAARDTLQAFDNQFFTPDVWYRMGRTMWRLYRRYLAMALRTARLMQQAYNFETDQALRLIRADYSTDEVKGLLGAQALMADIQSFTYDLITSKAGKPQPMRQTISLAERYGFAFENQFRKTGVLEFETSIDDFDAYYPGTYAGRLEAVEVEVDGIVPVRGISGTLTNSGVSGYRTPSSIPVGPTGSGLKYRVQSKETLILSDYAMRQDGLLVSNDQRMMRIFQGAGVVSTWRLELPKAINDIDYGALTDVRLTFYYKARFDPDLRERVLAEFETRPGVNARQRAIPLRWVYPDAFFRFQDTGALNITLRSLDFRRNETKLALTHVGVLVVTDGTVPASALSVALGTPGKTALTAKTDTDGAIESGTASGSSWAPLTGGKVVGPYTITFAAANNPMLVKDGKLVLTPIVNVALMLAYSFTPKT